MTGKRLAVLGLVFSLSNLLAAAAVAVLPLVPY